MHLLILAGSDERLLNYKVKYEAVFCAFLKFKILKLVLNENQSDTSV